MISKEYLSSIPALVSQVAQQEKQAAPAGLPIGVRAMNKIKGLLPGIFAEAKPVFGQGVADEAAEHGLHLLGDIDNVAATALNRANRQAGKKVYYGGQTTRNSYRLPGELTRKSVPKGKGARGVAVNFSSMSSPTAAKVRKATKKNVGLPTKATSNFEDKYYEAQQLKDVMAPTVRVGDLMKRYGIKSTQRDAGAKLQEAIRKELGDKFIVKPTRGYATAGSSLPTEKMDPVDFMNTLRGREGLGVGNYQETFTGPANFIAQKRYELQKNNRVLTAIDNLISKLTKREWSTGGGGVKEWRVHTSGGKVIPYATTGRGSMLSQGIPYYSPNARKAEAAAQKILDKMPDKFKNSSFGFDVAKTKDGKFVLIESNPSSFGGSSGYMQPGAPSMFSAAPYRQDALEAAVMGRLPAYIKAQRALEAAGLIGGAGTAGGGALMLNNRLRGQG